MKKEANAVKKKSRMPHVFVILVGLVFLAVILTYLIPAGTYDRIVDETTKQTIVDPSSFHYVDRHAVSFVQIPIYIYKAIVNAAPTIFMVLIGTASIEVLLATGAFNVALNKAIARLRGKEQLALLILMVLFALLGINTNSSRYIAYVPLIVALCRMCGYDAMCGAALIILSVGGTFSCGIASMAITAVAQDLAGLPKFSGFQFRALSAVVIFFMSAVYLLRYAKRVKLDPTTSVVYELECEARENSILQTETELGGAEAKISPRHCGVIAVFFANLVISVSGCLLLGWSNAEVCGVSMTAAVVGGLIGGFSLNEVAAQFAKGASKCLTTGLMIGIAGAISMVMKDGLIVDTVVNTMVSAFKFFPSVLQPSILYVLNSLVNCFITSGSGQAAVVMPIFLPLSDILGITRQTCVLAFNFGDGFSNFMIPTAASLMGVIGAADINLAQWYKFFGKLFILWSIAAMALTTIAQFIQL